MGRVLVVGTEVVITHVGEQLFRRGHEVVSTRRSDECLTLLEDEGVDAVILCLPIPGVDGQPLLEALRRRAVSVVVCGSDDSVPDSSVAFAHGAFEHVDDPISDWDDLLAAVGLALGSRRGDVQLRYLRQRDAATASWESLVGGCAAMQEVFQIVRRLCERSSRGGAPTVLLTGETGTGKGMLAKCIHYNGGRRTRPFVEVNCAAIPPTLLESELFGHERGAFTDAHTARAGLFETANSGTLFLDEIASLPLALQAKLLSAIEEKSIRRLGGRNSTHIDTQIVAATHVDLRQAIKQETFRADLYHRLNVVSVRMPSLRERGDDKMRLAESFVARACAEYGLPRRRLTPAARRYVSEYRWPGNVRELKNQIERILLLYNDDVIDDLHFDARRSSLPPPIKHSGFRLTLPEDGVALDDIEREAIKTALSRTGGNVSQAARFLRITRHTLIYRMRKHRLGEIERAS
jgi:DNA-binding NtrC family response regulator